ncbi:hypothetical protein Tco_0614875 [Tanacetum coccineum]
MRIFSRWMELVLSGVGFSMAVGYVDLVRVKKFIPRTAKKYRTSNYALMPSPLQVNQVPSDSESPEPLGVKNVVNTGEKAIQRSGYRILRVVVVVAVAYDWQQSYLSDYEISMEALWLLEVIPKEVDSFPSNWCSILREVKVLSAKGFDFFSHCKKKVGNGRNSRFWLDTWLLDKPFRVRFPRFFILEMDKTKSVAAKWDDPSFCSSFRRPVRDGIEKEQWLEMLSMLDTVMLSSSIDRWVKFVPKKINVFAWRARLDRLPTRLNLIKRAFSGRSVFGGIFLGEIVLLLQIGTRGSTL